MRTMLWGLRVGAWLVLLVLMATPHPASASPNPARLPTFELLTVGPGRDLLSLWGHSSLCRHSGTLENGVCFDFGISTVHDPVKLMVGTFRGEALFVSTPMPAGMLLSNYAFRQVHRQRLPLDASETRRLEAQLRQLVGTRYAYQPLFDNCSTRLRDLLDEITAGRLRKVLPGDDPDPKLTLRVLAERGLTGQAVLLLLTELGAGSAIDEPATLWQKMAFPSHLMVGVARRLNAPPTLIHEARTPVLPTSRHAGRLLLTLMSLLLSAALLLGRPRWRAVARPTAVLCLSILGVLPLIGPFGHLPSLKANWMLLIVTVADLLLFFGAKHRLFVGYVLARLGLIGLLLMAWTAGWIRQPILVPAGCTAALLGAWLIAGCRQTPQEVRSVT